MATLAFGTCSMFREPFWPLGPLENFEIVFAITIPAVGGVCLTVYKNSDSCTNRWTKLNSILIKDTLF